MIGTRKWNEYILTAFGGKHMAFSTGFVGKIFSCSGWFAGQVLLYTEISIEVHGSAKQAARKGSIAWIRRMNTYPRKVPT